MESDSWLLSNDSFKNVSIEEYLLHHRGPKHLPLSTAIPLTVINLIIFFTGILGNSVVCLVIIRNNSMHSATNYYLFSLAISDLTLLLFGLPNDLVVYWHQYPWTFGLLFCKFRALLSETASYVSVLTIVAFSTERYFAVCRPLHVYTMSRLSRTIRIISVLWIVSFAFATPFAVFTTVHYIHYPPGSDNIIPESAFCGMLEQPECCPLSEISSVLFFFIPLIVIIVLYSRMCLKISNRNQYFLSVNKQNKDSSRKSSTAQNRSTKTVSRMLSAVVAAFFICWAPFHLQRLMYIYIKDSPHFLKINEWLFYITGILYYVSSTVNPILYSVMSRSNRKAFCQTLFGKSKHQNSRTEVENQQNTAFCKSRNRCHYNQCTQIIPSDAKTINNNFFTGSRHKNSIVISQNTSDKNTETII